MMEQITINLALDVIYVYGTVNGAEAEFELVGPGLWQAIVPKSADGMYYVVITAYNALGTPTIYETVISMIEGLIPLKTDWGPNDDYGPDDLNRVEADTQYIAGQMEKAGYAVNLGPIRVDRDITGYEFADSLSRVEANIHALAQAFVEPPGYQQPKAWAPRMQHSYVDANRLEQNLQLLYDWLMSVIEGFRYCGTFICGEDGDIY